MDTHTDQQSILIVEDEQIVALDMRVRLERFGYRVLGSFPRAEEALSYLEEEGSPTPDCVLMDINLQGEMDGITAANIVRERFVLPVIIITAYADEETIQRAKASEPFAYIIKPFDDRELRTSIVISIYRHSMERRLQERERLLSAILGSIESGVIVTDLSQHITFSSEVAEELAGGSVSVGTPITEAIPAQVLDAARRGGIALWQRETGMREEQTIQLAVHPLRIPGPVDPGASRDVWVLQDISRRLSDERALREKDEQLAHAEKMDAVGRIAGGVAHDFNNLVTIMMGYSRLAIDDMERHRSIDDIRRNIEGVYETARRSSGLTRQLLAYSRVESINPTAIDADDSISKGAMLLESVVPENVHIEYILNARNAKVLIDPARLEQVLVNLLLNARDAMPSGGSIVVSTEAIRLEEPLHAFVRELPPGAYLRIQVVDSGDGIETDALPRIFEPFFTTKDRARGSGFGLATVYATTEDAGGAIQVASTVGQGTTFSVYLPLAEEVAGGVPSSGGEDEYPHGTETVAVIQEEDGLRRLVTRILRSHGYTPIVSRSVGDGLLLLEHTPEVKAIITDRSAPYLSVSEVVRRFRAVARQDAAVLVTVSGLLEDAGQDGTIQKPFEPADLLRILRDAIDARSGLA